MSEVLNPPIIPSSTGINNSDGKSITFGLSSSATESYNVLFPPENKTGYLLNDGDGNLSWSAGIGGGSSTSLTIESGVFTGEIKTATLTANRTYTLPNVGGNIVISDFSQSISCGEVIVFNTAETISEGGGPPESQFPAEPQIRLNEALGDSGIYFKDNATMIRYDNIDLVGKITLGGTGSFNFIIPLSGPAFFYNSVGGGSASSPLIRFGSELSASGLFISSGSLGFSSNNIRRSLLGDTYELWLGPSATATSVRFASVSGVGYIQHSGPFNASSETPTANVFTTLRFSPYLSSTRIVEINRNSVVLGENRGGDEVNLFINGTLSIGINQVLTIRQPAIASVNTLTTSGTNPTASSAGLSLIGNTTLTDQSTNIMQDFKSLQEDIANIGERVDLILTAMRTHGLIST